MVLSQDNNDPSRHGEGGGIVDVACDRSARVNQRDIPILLVEAATGEAPLPAPREMRMRNRVARRQIERLLQQWNRLFGPFWHSRVHVWQGAQNVAFASSAVIAAGHQMEGPVATPVRLALTDKHDAYGSRAALTRRVGV